MSLDSHKRGCTCAPCVSRRSGEAQRIAAAELEATRRDIAWFTVMSMGGPDAVLALARQHGDPGRAISLLKAAGFDVSGITDRWRAEAPSQSSSNPSLFANDPEHSPEAMAALASGGIPAWNAKVRELTEARAADRAGREAARRVMWTDARTGQPVMEDPAAGQPLYRQRSVIFPDVSPLGTEA